MHWSLTWEKCAFVLLIALLWVGFLFRRDWRKHVPIMVSASLGLLLLFSWIVVQRFTMPHEPVEGRPAIYWALFITHVVSGLVTLILCVFQGIMGGLLLGEDGRRVPKLRIRHRQLGYLIILMTVISLLSVVPL